MLKIGIAAIVLLTSIFFPYGAKTQGKIVNSPTTPRYPTDCINNLCKAKNEWYGGTVGIMSNISLSISDDCQLPYCKFMHKGVWAKIQSTGRYLGVITEKSTIYSPGDPRNTAYWVQNYVPGSGFSTYFLGTVQQNDYGHSGTFEVTWDPYSGYNTTCIANLNESGTLCLYGIDNTFIWDDVMVGFRVQSYPQGLTILGDFTGTQNQWQLSQNLQWYYQTVDGTMSNTAPDWLTQFWVVRPSDPNSAGGTYKGYCHCP